MVRLGCMLVCVALVSACSGVDGADGADGADGKAGPEGPRGSEGTGTPGAPGAPGPAGPAGANASPYGDGSAGAVTISTDSPWFSAPPAGNNYQFTDLTIAAGATLSVTSGTIIRCSGTFKNAGTIQVMVGAFPGNMQRSGDSFAFAPATMGNARTAPGDGAVAAINLAAPGGRGGLGIESSHAPLLLQPGLFGGSGGASWEGGFAGYGGGALVVLA